MEKIISALFCFVVLFLLLIPISAHPGRTDGSGGHYDRDSGGYHYHHGYPEHNHYDIDEDGDIDCPYSFHNNVDDTPKDDKSSKSDENDISDFDIKGNKPTIKFKDIISDATFEEVTCTLFLGLFLFGLFTAIVGIDYRYPYYDDESPSENSFYRELKNKYSIRHRKILSSLKIIVICLSPISVTLMIIIGYYLCVYINGFSDFFMFVVLIPYTIVGCTFALIVRLIYKFKLKRLRNYFDYKHREANAQNIQCL